MRCGTVDISAHSNAPYLMRPVSGVDSVTASVGLGTRSNVLSILRQSQVALEVTTPLSLGVIRPIGVENYVHVIVLTFVQW